MVNKAQAATPIWCEAPWRARGLAGKGGVPLTIVALWAEPNAAQKKPHFSTLYHIHTVTLAGQPPSPGFSSLTYTVLGYLGRL